MHLTWRPCFTGFAVIVIVSLTWSSSYAVEKGPIKIGILAAATGPMTTAGGGIKNGFFLYLEQVGKKIAGRNVEVIFEDSAGNPSTGLTKARKLVELDKVDILTGENSSSVCLAIRDYLSSQAIPSLLEGTVDEIADGKWIFRTTFPAKSNSFWEGTLPAKDGHKKAVAIAPNFSAGKVAVEWFERGFVSKGGTVIKKILPPENTLDYGPFLTGIPPEAQAGLVFFTGGSASIRFIKQYAEYGLKKKLPLYGGSATVDEEILEQQGEAAEGFVGGSFYYTTIESPENKSFVQAYVKRFGVQPNWFAAGSYIAAMVIDAAAKKVDGKVENKDAFLQALRGVRVTTPAGPLRFENNEPIQPRYAAQIRKVGGKMVPVIIDVVPDFSPNIPK